MISRLLRTKRVRVAIVGATPIGLGAALWWFGPDWGVVGDAFTRVQWEWVAAAIGLNFASIVVRAIAWTTVVDQAMPPPHPRFRHVFSAFSVGLMGNAVLPGRVGEIARVAVLSRHLPHRGVWATLVGSVFAHRVFDLVPTLALVAWVLATARIPHWAITSLIVILSIGAALFLFAVMSARHHHRGHHIDGLGTVRRLVMMGRRGLGVMHRPVAAAVAILFQCLGWFCQLLAVWAAMKAFNLGHLPLPAAGVVLVLMNVAAILPLWPGNIGLLQAAIALPLVEYGVAYGKGFAFGIGLQAIEASVGVAFGLLFLAREGLSFAMLRAMPRAVEAEVPEEAAAEPAEELERPRAGVPG